MRDKKARELRRAARFITGPFTREAVLDLVNSERRKAAWYRVGMLAGLIVGLAGAIWGALR